MKRWRSVPVAELDRERDCGQIERYTGQSRDRGREPDTETERDRRAVVGGKVGVECRVTEKKQRRGGE